MKILILGGSYFIGWNLLLSSAENKRNEIWVINRATRKRQYPVNVTHIKCDRSDSKKMIESVKDKFFDVIYDLCAVKREDSEGACKIFAKKTKHFIHISSPAVYLPSESFPIKETFSVGRHPVWGEYGQNKLNTEEVLMKAHQSSDFPVTIVRPSYVYGTCNNIPREKFLFDRIQQDRPILLPNGGDAIIQLGHVKDLVHALILIANHPKRSIGEIYNISNNEYITLRGLTMLVGKIMGKKVNIISVDTKRMCIPDRDIFPFDNETYFTDIKKVKKHLNFDSMYTLEKGFTEEYLFWKDSEKEVVDFTKENKILKILGAKNDL